MFDILFYHYLISFFLSKNLIVNMNSGERSNSNSSKNSLQQKKLEYFGITNNFVQGKGKSTASHTGENVAHILYFNM